MNLRPIRTTSQPSLLRTSSRHRPQRVWLATLLLIPLITTLALPIMMWRNHYRWHARYAEPDDHLVRFKAAMNTECVLRCEDTRPTPLLRADKIDAAVDTQVVTQRVTPRTKNHMQFNITIER